MSKVVLEPGAFAQETVVSVAAAVATAPRASISVAPRPSIAQAVMPAAVQSVPVPAPIPKHKEHEKWKSALKPQENIIATALVIKPNPLGMQHKRQLILIAGPKGPRLVYLDPKSLEVKGEVEWTKAAPPTCYAGSKVAFEIAVSKRIYKFTDNDNGAEFWVKHINDAIRMFA